MKNKIHSAVLFTIYFIINMVFLIKYGARQNIIPLSVLCIGFLIVNVLMSRISKSDLLIKKINTKSNYILVIIITVIYLVFCHLLNDPVKLNIDRWETLNYSTENWLQGNFFYDKVNHLGNKSSYLPGQLLLAAPFYLLGNVGYLQIAVFLLFCYALMRQFGNHVLVFQGILMLGVSLSFNYEVICKSDFISSFVVAATFILLWHQKFRDNYFKRSFLLGLFLGIICLTRSAVIIPIILFLMSSFVKADAKSILKIGMGFIISSGLLLASVLLPAKDLQTIYDHNPLLLQGQSNTIVSAFLIAITLVVSVFVKKINDVYYYSSYFLFALMACYLLEQYIVWETNYFESAYFATTYLAAGLPFCIIGYCFALEERQK
ncbi:hypothetical protein [Epilithonimonas mollis]|uniref:Glycosyltransferase RgtA/B/C/D-like domain-containing protein n=1 Tax=Epilithonimonas mollis TaxID=216903 RepID=A0A1M6T420_9FLAO|nr:hypothetical protein [Epilithonimonas mollis]SHK51660.1 hypothetical protein SAMN05444371_2626 [Epilithonimonas mollis]